MMTNSGSREIPWILRHSLRLLFPLTLPWIPLFLFANDIYNAVPEGHRYHTLIENLLVPAFLSFSVLLSIVLYRFGPGFLRVPGRVPVSFWVLRVIIHPLVIYILLTILTLFVSLLLDPPPWNSNNPQYIPLVFFAVVFYPPLLTPIVAFITIWRSILQKAEETSC